MKTLIFFILIFYIIPGTFSQTNNQEIELCHDENLRLKRATEGNFILEFEDQALKFIHTKDSSIYYDVKNMYFKVHTQFNNVITIKLNSDGTIVLYDAKYNKLYKRNIVSENKECISQSNFSDMYNSDTSFISFTYQFCRLSSVFIGDMHIGSINMLPYQCGDKKLYTWDITIVPYSKDVKYLGKSLKILTEKNSGIPNFISVCDEIRLSPSEKDPGIEFVSESNKPNKFDKIQKVISTPNQGVFLYTDLITYKNNGKINNSFIPTHVCE